MENNYNIVQHFEQAFTIRIADTKILQEQVYAIRYNVYCQEFGFTTCEGVLEKDEYDSIATQCLVTHIQSNKPAGCIRLIPAQYEKLPIEHACVDLALIDTFDRSSVCEISRLAVDPMFRRRHNEKQSKYGAVHEDSFVADSRTFSLIGVAAFLAGTALANIKQTPHAFAIMEPFLPRLLCKSSIVFNKVGEPIEYHGIRQPYYANYNTVVQSLPPDVRELYNYIEKQLIN